MGFNASSKTATDFESLMVMHTPITHSGDRGRWVSVSSRPASSTSGDPASKINKKGASDIAQFAERLLSMHPRNRRAVVQACNLITWKTELGRSDIQGHSLLPSAV